MWCASHARLRHHVRRQVGDFGVTLPHREARGVVARFQRVMRHARRRVRRWRPRGRARRAGGAAGKVRWPRDAIAAALRRPDALVANASEEMRYYKASCRTARRTTTSSSAGRIGKINPLSSRGGDTLSLGLGADCAVRGGARSCSPTATAGGGSGPPSRELATELRRRAEAPPPRLAEDDAGGRVAILGDRTRATRAAAAAAAAASSTAALGRRPGGRP